jgi:hypothetical protein
MVQERMKAFPHEKNRRWPSVEATALQKLEKVERRQSFDAPEADYPPEGCDRR